MPIESYNDQLEPRDQDAVIWRFLNMKKFGDLIVSGELYFCRADLFKDEREGLPPQEYLPKLGLNPFDLGDRQELANSIGSAAEFRESFYVNCWHLFQEETCRVWEEYGKDGVAICSRYGLLKSALNAMPDRASLGLVRYESSYLARSNVLSYITNKRAKYAHEQEVRAFLWIMDPLGTGNRHIDIEGRVHPHVLTPPPDRVSTGQRRVVDLNKLITEIVVTPWASPTLVGEIDGMVKDCGRTIPVVPSELTRFRTFLPDPPFSHIVRE
jgi:hypothetical protein